MVLALFVPLIISSGGNSGSQASTLVIRAMALGEVRLRDWWRVMRREIAAGLVLGAVLGAIGFLRIVLWQAVPPHLRRALPADRAHRLRQPGRRGDLRARWPARCCRSCSARLGFDPASASAPFVATLVDVSGLVIYFTVAALILRGTLL